MKRWFLVLSLFFALPVLSHAAETAAAYEKQARQYLKEKNWDKALEAATKAVELDPNMAEAYADQLAVYQKQGVWIKGLDAGKKAIELDPNLARAHFHLGLLYYEQGLPEEAAIAFKKTAEIDPAYPEIQFYLGKSYGASDDTEHEIEAYKKALETSPDKAGAHRELGAVYHARGDYETALKEFEAALKLNAKDAKLYLYRGRTFLKKEKKKEALADFKKSVELDAENIEAHEALAPLATELRDPVTASRSYEKMLEKDPNFTKFGDLAFVYQVQGKKDEAIATWERALAQAPEDPDIIYYNLGTLYRAKKEPARAVEYYLSAIAAKDHADYHYALSIAYCDQKLAAQAWEEASKSKAMSGTEPDQLVKYLRSACPGGSLSAPAPAPAAMPVPPPTPPVPVETTPAVPAAVPPQTPPAALSIRERIQRAGEAAGNQ